MNIIKNLQGCKVGILGTIFLKNNQDNNRVKKINKKKDFNNITINSTNIDNDLRKVANEYDIDLKELDFTIISYRTYYRFAKEDKFYMLNDIELEDILSKKNLLNPKLELKQQYKINIFKKSIQGEEIKIVLGTNMDYTKIYATIKKNSSINYHDKIGSEIITQINKKKARQGILIGFMDDIITDEIHKIISHIMVHQAILEDFQILVCKGLERINEQKEIINFLYKDKNKDENQKITLNEKSNIAIVKDGETIIEVIKAHKGQDGRNCKGEFLPKQIMTTNSKIEYKQLKFSDNFEIVEDENKIRVIAKKNGYITTKGYKFDISDDIVVKQVNIKTTGSIKAKDKDIKVNVENNDENVDAIASGIVLDTKEIKVKGNVGSKAKITADNIDINGQTHQTSMIYGKNVKINLHKGFIDADKVEINVLEGGKVVCDEIYIDTVTGGEIKAKKIYAKRVISNTKLMASESIEIEQLDGNTNKIIIDPTVQRGYNKIVSNLQKDIKKLEQEIEKENKNLKILKKKILSDKKTIEEIKEAIVDFKRRGEKIPLVMINKIKEDKNNKVNFNKLVAYTKDLKNQLIELKEKLNKFFEAIFDAYILLKSPWKEYNEVIFKIVEPQKDISRLMSEGEKGGKLMLKSKKDNQYIIANVD